VGVVDHQNNNTTAPPRRGGDARVPSRDVERFPTTSDEIPCEYDRAPFARAWRVQRQAGCARRAAGTVTASA